MSITREQVADLREGDVVELRLRGQQTVLTGELRPFPMGQYPRPGVSGHVGLTLGPNLVLRRADGGLSGMFMDDWILNVVSRAPRPLYVNHSRTEPLPGDVVRDADQALARDTWTWNEHRAAWSVNGQSAFYDVSAMPTRLRLLVDGETGQVVS